MPTLNLTRIKCNSLTNFGGPIELRLAIPQNPNQTKSWGPQTFQVGQFVDFNQPPLPQQLPPIPFFNPIRVELWDSRYSAKVREIEIRPTNVGSSPSSPPAPPTFTYFGGTYTLSYVVTANVVELLFSYAASALTLLAAFIANLTLITLETARSALKLIVAPVRGLISGRNDEPEPISEDDFKPLEKDSEPIQRSDSEKVQR
jgi:hypothetical protein